MHRARKRFGQNFLIDQSIIQSIITAIAPKPLDNILEIGPGLGALTKPLADKLTSLEVIELDKDLIRHLESLKKEVNKLEIYQADALTFNFSQPEQPRRIVGNLPYNISTPLIFHLLDNLDSIIDMHFMLQKEVVDKICATSGERNFGRLSAMVQARCHVQKLLNVPAESFSPIPKVASAFIRLLPREDKILSTDLENHFKHIVQTCFSQPRKTIYNNLKHIFTQDQIIQAGMNPLDRPQQLTIENLLALSKLNQS